ncbi:hypothetical protein [Actinoplanes palleronii]|uniref:hypothetical protein n=1 Tax=Actinoplanes palleronii TaxID=113570 RepID=UPI001944FF02|nr:hypothetical protein [Actinoplanes palleronii]
MDIDGAAPLVLTDVVVPLHPEDAVFDAMLLGWRRQQRSRLLSPATVMRFCPHRATAIAQAG